MLRIYSEMLPYAELLRPRTIALLARYRLEIVLAVRPWDLRELLAVTNALRDAGVPLSVWPMLADSEGRWANRHNVAAFTRFVDEVLDVASPRDVLFDLEPPFGQARTLATLGASHFDPRGSLAALRMPTAPLDTTERELRRSVTSIHGRGITTSLAVWPLVALDPIGSRSWQSILGTPVDGLATPHVSVMMYTSIFEGWSRGMLRRRDAMSLLAAGTERSMRRWGEGTSISLGCVGTGAFSDEPIYRDPIELAEDVAIVRAAGCTDLALFDLAGVLSREPAEAWLDAFTGEPREKPATSDKERWRVTGVRLAARTATRALGVFRRSQGR